MLIKTNRIKNSNILRSKIKYTLREFQMSYNYNKYYPQQPHRQLRVQSRLQNRKQPHRQAHSQEARIKKLKDDNIELQKGLKQLNQCYSAKIQILECLLQQSKQRQCVLLEWKRVHIDKHLFQKSRYQSQVQKMVHTMQEAANLLQTQTATSTQELSNLSLQIEQLKQQNSHLISQRENKDNKIQRLAKKYISQIQRLNTQLKHLKQQVDYDGIADRNQFSEDGGERMLAGESQGGQGQHVHGQGQHVHGQEIGRYQQADLDSNGLGQDAQTHNQQEGLEEEQNPLRDISNWNRTHVACQANKVHRRQCIDLQTTM